MDEQAREAVQVERVGGWWPVTAALTGAVFAGFGALYFALVENAAEGLGGRIWQTSPAWMFLVMPVGLGLIRPSPP